MAQLPGVKGATTTQFVDAVVANLSKEAKTEKAFDFKDVKRDALPVTNLMMTTPRNLENEETVGVDLFIDSDLSPKTIADNVNAVTEKHGLKIIMLSNRGTQVYPTGSVLTQCVNHYRCRLQFKEGVKMAESELYTRVSEVAKVMRVCSLEMLRKIDGKNMFSLAQGQ